MLASTVQNIIRNIFKINYSVQTVKNKLYFGNKIKIKT